jgi:hypothetical protein
MTAVMHKQRDRSSFFQNTFMSELKQTATTKIVAAERPAVSVTSDSFLNTMHTTTMRAIQHLSFCLIALMGLLFEYGCCPSHSGHGCFCPLSVAQNTLSSPYKGVPAS